MIILKKDFAKDSIFQYSLFNTSGGVVTDIEFFDDKELGICLQTDQSKRTKNASKKYSHFIFSR